MSIEAMKQALEALEYTALKWPQVEAAITSLRQAIAEAEKHEVSQEPVAWGFQNTAITGSNRWNVLNGDEVDAAIRARNNND